MKHKKTYIQHQYRNMRNYAALFLCILHAVATVTNAEQWQKNLLPMEDLQTKQQEWSSQLDNIIMICKRDNDLEHDADEEEE
eukprot:3672404-Ditylum_brightwellii.AAC.1